MIIFFYFIIYFFTLESSKDVEAEDYHTDLRELAKSIIDPWQKNERVAVKYETKWYPGFIKEVIEKKSSFNFQTFK